MARKDNIKNATTIYRGMYECTNIHANAVFNGKLTLSNTNDVIFMDNLETTAPITTDSVLFVLPEECRPSKRTRLYVGGFIKSTPTTNGTYVIDIFPNGEVKNRVNFSNTNNYQLFFYGLSFNVSGKYYG